MSMCIFARIRAINQQISKEESSDATLKRALSNKVGSYLAMPSEHGPVIGCCRHGETLQDAKS